MKTVFISLCIFCVPELYGGDLSMESAFKTGEPIAKSYTGEGEDVSPYLYWKNAPAGAKSFAMIMDDPDAPNGDWVHWVVYNIPVMQTGWLDEGIGTNKQRRDKHFCVYGKVIEDSRNRGLGGVIIRAATGMGTLSGHAATITDENGQYELFFGAGMAIMDPDSAPHGVGTQAAVIYAHKSGYYERNLCAAGNLAMSENSREQAMKEWKNADGAVLYDQPYKLNFVMTESAELAIKVVDNSGTAVKDVMVDVDGETRYPATSIFAEKRVDGNGQVIIEDVPLKKWNFSIRKISGPSWKDIGPATSPSDHFSISKPELYEITLKYDGTTCTLGPVSSRPPAKPAADNLRAVENAGKKWVVLTQLPDGSMQGKNSWGNIGYQGPMPPKGKPHRYFFKLYALDTMLDLQPGATKYELLDAMKGHILDQTQIYGTYQR